MTINPVALLVSLVALIAITTGAVLVVFAEGGDSATVVTRVGVVTAISGSAIASIVALLLAGRADHTATTAAKAINGHIDAVDINSQRIGAIEQQVANMQPSSPDKGAS